jgi:dihydroneopterin triphosphate diphosphatase
MARAPFQILAVPYRKNADSKLEFAIFARADYPCWQGIAGGGEDTETPIQAAQRECNEEAGLSPDSHFITLDTISSIPVAYLKDNVSWGDVYVIPEYCFGVDAVDQELHLSHEHIEFRWLAYAEASALLTYDSNRTALWELNQKLQGKRPREDHSNSC